MSNTTANVVDVPETEAPVEETPAQETKKKNVAYRIFSFLFVALAITSLFLPFAYVLKDDGAMKTGLFFSIIDLFGGKSVSKLFGFLPSYVSVSLDIGGMSMLGIVTTFVYYLFFLFLLTSVVLGIIGIFTSKKAPAMLRLTVFFFLLAFSMNTLWNIAYVFSITDKFLLDYLNLSATVLGLIAYLVLALLRVGKKAWISFIQFILSLAVSCMIILAFEADTSTFEAGIKAFGIKPYQIIIMSVVALCLLNAMCGYIRVQLHKGLPFDFIRYSLQMIIAGIASYMELAHNKGKNKLFVVLAIVATGISIVQLVICILQAVAYKKAKKAELAEAEPIEEATEDAPVQEYVTEEQVEAVPYEGGPVDGVATAELVEDEPVENNNEETPVQEAKEEEPKTAGYDFYNTRSFDPFIATLNDTERGEFTDLFVLRCKGDMPEIPNYVVGEPKKDFFRKIFVYLGKYRDLISDELLSKIYQFSLKLK